MSKSRLSRGHRRVRLAGRMRLRFVVTSSLCTSSCSEHPSHLSAARRVLPVLVSGYRSRNLPVSFPYSVSSGAIPATLSYTSLHTGYAPHKFTQVDYDSTTEDEEETEEDDVPSRRGGDDNDDAPSEKVRWRRRHPCNKSDDAQNQRHAGGRCES